MIPGIAREWTGSCTPELVAVTKIAAGGSTGAPAGPAKMSEQGRSPGPDGALERSERDAPRSTVNRGIIAAVRCGRRRLWRRERDAIRALSRGVRGRRDLQALAGQNGHRVRRPPLLPAHDEPTPLESGCALCRRAHAALQ